MTEGQQISKQIYIVNIGITECGTSPCQLCPSAPWAGFLFSECYIHNAIPSVIPPYKILGSIDLENEKFNSTFSTLL